MLTMTNALMRIGVGIDTARYGHRVNYLRDDRQLAAKPVTITEDRDGYDRLQNDLQLLHRKHPEATLHVHIDAAGQYAANLERFLRTMELPIIVSVGEPKRNKDYHAAISPKRTTDNTESLAMARFALVEQPPATPDVPQAFILLREIAARLHGQIKDKTRAINRLHNLVSRVFPELATIAPNLDAAWVLDLLDHYSSPKRIAAARLDSLKKLAPARKRWSKCCRKRSKGCRSQGIVRSSRFPELVRGQPPCWSRKWSRLNASAHLKKSSATLGSSPKKEAPA